VHLKLEEIYPKCRSILEPKAWSQLIAGCDESAELDRVADRLAGQSGAIGLPAFLPDLARVEWARYKAAAGEIAIPRELEQLQVNPTLVLLTLSWKLSSLLTAESDASPAMPIPGEELLLVWRDSGSGKTETKAATEEDLLVLKMVIEEVDPAEAAASGEVPIGSVDAAIDRAVHRGILLAPPSRIRRDSDSFPLGQNTPEHFLSASSFTLQWHVTQACDLHCKHCYDRSRRSSLSLDRAVGILDDLRSFCLSQYVRKHVSFTGGNPLLYPHFSELYRAASERGFSISILGNPTPRERMEELLAIQKLTFFQVSLEGLPEHNDTIRGPGHFARVIEFLAVLRELDIYSTVMLTLTRDNIDQVLPLTERLRGLADDFTFNRLSPVGEGANLQLPTREKYAAFLEAYVAASENNPIIGFKDNLINILLHQKGRELFGGCTGYGCGAAFNFMAVLPDGEAHACRKFPSLIGNVLDQSIADIYESDIARRYRQGCNTCRSCAIRPVCGGCLSIAHGHGLDMFEERDPQCFMEMA